MSRNRGSRRQYAMTPQTPITPVSQEAAVAALQATTQHLNERVGDLAKATQEGMQSIAHKLDEISRQSSEIAAIAAAQREHGNGLERAFGDIRTTNERINAVVVDVKAVEKTANMARGGLIVLSGIGMLVIGLLVWALSPTLQAANQNAVEIRKLELRILELEAKSEVRHVDPRPATPP